MYKQMSEHHMLAYIWRRLQESMYTWDNLQNAGQRTSVLLSEIGYLTPTPKVYIFVEYFGFIGLRIDYKVSCVPYYVRMWCKTNLSQIQVYKSGFSQ